MNPDLTISEIQHLALEVFEDPQVVRMVWGGGAGGGKAKSLDTPIPTPDGWKLNGELKPGDVIYGPDGSEIEVLQTHPVRVGPSYRVRFDDGTHIDVDADHLWNTFTYNERKNNLRRTEAYRAARREKRGDVRSLSLQGKNIKESQGQYGTTRTTLEILHTLKARGGTHANHAILNAQPLMCKEKEYHVPPYVLGVWLGDGSKSSGALTNIDDEVWSTVESNGYTVGPNINPYTRTVYGLITDLRKLNVVNNKHIPQEYLRGSVDQRKELLRGLMDSDGTIDKGGKASFTNTNIQIIEGVKELLASLGLKYFISTKSTGYQLAYNVYFRPNFVCFNIKRKADRQDLGNYRESNRYRYIVDVEKIDDVPMRCITVSHPSHLYLCGRQMVPTHNSFLIGLLVAMACKKYPKSRWALTRKELKSLKQTTLATLISKVHPVLGISEGDYKVNMLDSTLEYMNGSQILLLDLTAKPSDPEMESLGSLELTGAFVDEVGEVNKKAYDVLASRVNRWMNKEYGITGKIVASTNPSPGFVRQEFYDKYDQLGGGRLQKWKNGHVWVEGERVDAYDVYIRSTALDNPFLDQNYIEGLKRLPPQERRRLLDGDWNYTDEDDSLFKMALIDKMTVYEVPESDKFSVYMGIDPGGDGKDDTVVTIVENGVIIKQYEIKSPRVKDQGTGYYLAGKVIGLAEKHGLTKPLAKNITVEDNGIGNSIRDALIIYGWRVNTYTATLQSRNEGYYQFMTDADDGKIQILNTVIEDGKLLRQLAVHRFDLDSGKPRITPKKEIRKVLNRSPDHADSAMIANLAVNKFKPRDISSYIRW